MTARGQRRHAVSKCLARASAWLCNGGHVRNDTLAIELQHC